MKKTLALILSILALLIPVSAVELDVAEAADVAVEETAVLAASGVTPTVPVYDVTYGELIYFEDFSDNAWNNAYTPGTTAYAVALEGGSNNTPENGYGLVESTTLSLQMDNLGITDITSLTVKADVLRVAGKTRTSIPVWGPGNLSDWGSFTIDSANESTWTTQTYTFKKAMTLSATHAEVHTRMSGLYVDNISLYVTYDLGNKIRLVENNVISYADLTDLETYTFVAPANTALNAWYCYDNKAIYMAGQAYNASDLAGKTYKPVYMPELEHETYGDLLYFSDAGDDYARNYVNKAVVGENATASYQLGYDAEKAWGNNVVDDPANSGRGKVEKLTTGTKYKYYNGIYPKFKNFNVKNAEITVVWDIYIDAETAASVTDPRFYFQTAGGFNKVTSASYDMTAGGWQTIVMPYTANPLTFSAEQNINTMFGFAETGKTYYVDNFRVYAKIPEYAAKPAATTEDGTLVFFYNGNTDDSVNTIGADIIGEGSMGVYDNYHITYTTDCTALFGSCISHGIAIAPSGDAYTKNGTLTLVVEQFNNMNRDMQYTAISDVEFGSYKYDKDFTHGYPNYDCTYSTSTGNWYTLKATAATENKKFGFFERAWYNHANLTRGFKSIAVYFVPYTVTIGADVVDLADYREYTLPTGEGFNYYKDENGAYYEAGKAYASYALDGKTLTALQIDYATRPADVNLARGILVYFDNGNEADFYSNINASLVGFGNTTDVDGYFTRDLSNPASAGFSGTVGVGLDTGNTETKLAYADGTDMNGAIYLVVDMYNNSDANNSFYRAVRTKWDYWCGVYTDWVSVSAKAKQWTNVADAFDSELSFIGFADTDYSNWQGSTFRRVYAYYMPYARITLNDKVNPQVIDLTVKTEYTFPAISDGNTVWVGQDGSYYFPGDVAAVADINGVTFDTANFDGYAPETDDNVEIRLTSNTATNGIRFKASIVTSKKAAADEIGFIVAREDVLQSLGDELTFDITAEGVENAEGVLFVKGVAYDKASGKNLIYDTTTDGSAEVFTGVCVGIDTTSKVQVNTALVARPYVKMTVAGKQLTVYGGINSSSLAEAAQNLKTAAEEGNEAAINAYNGSKDYIDRVINVAAGN